MGSFDFQDWFPGYDAGTANTASYNAEQTQLKQQAAAQQAADAKAAEEKIRLKSVRDLATTNARGGANKYFSDLGLDPGTYGGDIDAALNDALGSINESDPTPGAYLKNVGQTAYTNAENAARQRAGRSVDTSFSPNYDRSRISDTLDDPILEALNQSERGKADEFVNRLFKRGVITGTGKAGAAANLDEQGGRVRSQLGDIGKGVLETGRGDLMNVINRARSNAGNLKLGQSFDPSTYEGDANRVFDEFSSGLSDTIRSQTPQGLYDTSGLANIAGAASGAQNTKFDPLALAGQDQEEPIGTTPGKKKRTLF